MSSGKPYLESRAGAQVDTLCQLQSEGYLKEFSGHQMLSGIYKPLVFVFFFSFIVGRMPAIAVCTPKDLKNALAHFPTEEKINAELSRLYKEERLAYLSTGSKVGAGKMSCFQGLIAYSRGNMRQAAELFNLAVSEDPENKLAQCGVQLSDPIVYAVRNEPWFRAMDSDQQGSVTYSLKKGFLSEFPVYGVGFDPLDKDLAIYDASDFKNQIGLISDLKQEARTETDATAAYDQERFQFAIHAVDGASLEIEYQGKRGWIRRSSVRLDSVVLATIDGRYLRDIFPMYFSGGSRASLALRFLDDEVYFVVKLKKDYKDDHPIVVGFQYSPSKNEITGVRPMAQSDGKAHTKPLEEILSGEDMDRLASEIGLDKPEVVRLHDGRIIGVKTDYPLDRKAHALSAGKYLLLNSSFFPFACPYPVSNYP